MREIETEAGPVDECVDAAFQTSLAPLVRRRGPNAAHLKIEGKMLGDNLKQVVADLEELRTVYSWRAR